MTSRNELAGAALDLDAIMAVAAGRAAELCGADAAVVEIAEGEEMVCRAVSGAANEDLG